MSHGSINGARVPLVTNTNGSDIMTYILDWVHTQKHLSVPELLQNADVVNASAKGPIENFLSIFEGDLLFELPENQANQRDVISAASAQGAVIANLAGLTVEQLNSLRFVGIANARHTYPGERHGGALYQLREAFKKEAVPTIIKGSAFLPTPSKQQTISSGDRFHFEWPEVGPGKSNVVDMYGRVLPRVVFRKPGSEADSLTRVLQQQRDAVDGGRPTSKDAIEFVDFLVREFGTLSSKITAGGVASAIAAAAATAPLVTGATSSGAAGGALTSYDRRRAESGEVRSSSSVSGGSAPAAAAVGPAPAARLTPEQQRMVVDFFVKATRKFRDCQTGRYHGEAVSMITKMNDSTHVKVILY